VGMWDPMFYLTDLGKDLAFEIQYRSRKSQNGENEH